MKAGSSGSSGSSGRFQECPLLEEQLVGLIEIAVYILGAPRVPQQGEGWKEKGSTLH